MKIPCRYLLSFTASVLLTFTATVVRATPYASEVTYNATSGTVQFYINESGGNVTITYEDGSTNANFDGIDTGTNLAAGPYSFSLAGHTSYTISIFKVGTGVPSLVPSPIQTPNTYFYVWSENYYSDQLNGIDVNKNPLSPYFGRIYSDESYSPDNLYAFNPDGSLITNTSAGVSWVLYTYDGDGYANSPYRLAVAPDDSLLVGDGSTGNAGIWRVAPDLSTNELLLGPVGDQSTNAAGQIVHGDIFSRPLLTGPLTNNMSATLMEIDNDFPSTDPNALLIYTNVSTNSLPYELPPAVVGPEIGLNFAYLENVFGGLTQGGSNNYIYASNYRNNYSVATVDIFDSTGTNLLWNSLSGDGGSINSGPDAFVTTDPLGDDYPTGPADTAVSKDGNYFVALADDNHFTICQLTNGIPNIATIQIIDTLYDYNYGVPGAVCWDAADNIYFVSSSTDLGQIWTLGLTTTAITTGNASGTTGFQVVYPPDDISVVASNSFVSQANSYGNPTSDSFILTRSGPATNALTVSYTFSGTALGATNDGVSYPESYAVNPPSSVTFGVGVTSAVVTVTATADSIPRPTTALTISIAPSGSYLAVFPETATINILNTAPQELFTTVGSPTMYNAFSNDYCSFSITRWGDSNAAPYTVSSFNVTGGNAVEGTDYTPPSPVTIHPGDLTDYSYIYPLIHGQIPLHTNNLPYTGNKTITASLVSSSGYTAVANSDSFTIVDSGTPVETILFSDPLTNSAPTNWVTTATDENYPNTTPDYFADFGYNLAENSLDPAGAGAIPVPYPPNGQGTALRLTSNKNSTDQSQTTYSTAVNVYPTNVTFSGNYAVRFNMNVTEPYNFATEGSFEGPLFGINCSGIETNWWANDSPSAPATTAGAEADWNMDGIWVWLSDDSASQYADYTLFAGASNSAPESITPAEEANAASFENNFKNPTVFTCTAPGSTTAGTGMPCNGSPDNNAVISSWADVEIQQYNGVITLLIDKTPILVYTNTTSFTNGTIMLGYENPVFGTDGGDGAAYYSNLQVVRLGPPQITGTTYNKSSGTFTFDFNTTDGDTTTASYSVLGSATANGTYVPVAGATITSLGGNALQATVPVNGAIQFYQIQQQL